MKRSNNRSSWQIALVIAGLTLLFAQRAEAAPGSAILAYGKIGGLIPVTKLGPHMSVRLGGGVVLPVLKGRIAAVLDLGYSQTTAGETIRDPRLGDDGAGQDYSYSLTQRDLNLFLGPQVYILDPSRRIVPYAALGLDLHFLRSEIEGDVAGEPLGKNEETSTKAGFALRGGAGYRLGPGMITGEVSFAWAPIDHDITGDSHLGRVAIHIGYTAIFGL